MSLTRIRAWWRDRRQDRDRLRELAEFNTLAFDWLIAAHEQASLERAQIMADIEGLKAAVARIATGVEGLKTEGAALKTELAADGDKIKELTDKLASMPPAGSDPSTDTAVNDVISQLNDIADGLPKKANPVVDAATSTADAANAVSAATDAPQAAAEPAPAPIEAPTAPDPAPSPVVDPNAPQG